MDTIELDCNCPDFKQTAGEGGLELDPNKIWMSDATRCMHTRFLFSHFQDAIRQIPDVVTDDDNTHLNYLREQMLKSAYSSANSDVVVVSHVSCLIIHVVQRPSDLGVFVKINPYSHDTTSSCKCSKGYIRGKPEYWLKTNLEEFACIHIKRAVQHINIINDFVKKKKRLKITKKRKVERFSKEEGKWISASLLQHKPKQRGDEDYHR
jgi:hypothetical protein